MLGSSQDSVSGLEADGCRSDDAPAEHDRFIAPVELQRDELVGCLGGWQPDQRAEFAQVDERAQREPVQPNPKGTGSHAFVPPALSSLALTGSRTGARHLRSVHQKDGPSFRKICHPSPPPVPKSSRAKVCLLECTRMPTP